MSILRLMLTGYKRTEAAIHYQYQCVYQESKFTHPTWKSTFGPMQKKQSIIRKANTIGMLLINLHVIQRQRLLSQMRKSNPYKLRNQGSDATDSCTSTSWKCSWITGKHRCTRDSNTRWSRSVPCMEGLGYKFSNRSINIGTQCKPVITGKKTIANDFQKPERLLFGHVAISLSVGTLEP